MDTHLHLLSRYHRHGDADAFGVLVRDHAGMVFATARRITGDAALAEDVAQETFLELARSGHGVAGSVAAWLHRVAWRKACNAVRGESRRRRHEQAAADMHDGASEPAWEELEQQIDEVVNELPATLREPLVQHYLEGRAQQEVAARIGVSQSTVSRHLDAGIRELRARLQARGVFCGAGLAALLSAHTAHAAPASLTSSLGKLAISGAGVGAAVPGSAFITSTLHTMTTATKVLLVTAGVAVISVPTVLHRSPAKEPKEQASPARAKPQAKETAAGKTPSDPATHYYRPRGVSLHVRQSVDHILKRHAGLSKEQLKKSAELNKLMDRFIAVLGTPEMLMKIEQRSAAMPPVKGSQQGTLRMDFERLDDAHGRAWLEAAVSEDPQRIEDWILNTLDGAIFEFAFDPDLEQTSNGVSLHSSPEPESDAPQNAKTQKAP